MRYLLLVLVLLLVGPVQAERDPAVTIIVACGGQMLIGVVDDGESATWGMHEMFKKGGPYADLMTWAMDNAEKGATVIDITERLNRWLGMPCPAGT